MLSELKKIKIESVRNLPNAEKRIEEINNYMFLNAIIPESKQL